MNVLDILDALGVGEDKDWEFKRATGGLPGSLWETYSAMANTDGGTIVLGVAQAGDDFVVKGIGNPTKMRQDFWNLVNNRQKVSLNLLTNSDVSVKTMTDRHVLVIRVPRAGRRQRPVYVGQNPLTGTHRRDNEGDYHCSEDEVRRMFSDASTEPVDSRILEHFSLDDLDATSIDQYRNRFSAFRPGHVWLDESTTGFLLKLGAWRAEKSTGREGPTIAGMLMFGESQAIRDPEAVPGFHLDYRERLSNDPHERWTDRLVDDGTWEANVFQFYQRVLPRLTADLKTPFRLGRDLYRRDETPVHEAVREALVNALIHADYFGLAGVVVEKYADRFELSNPGTLLIPLAQVWEGGRSECRNKTLQKMFRMVGGGEQAGSGANKIYRNWKTQHWRAPSILTTPHPDRVKLVLPMVSLLPQDALAWLRNEYGAFFDGLNSTEVQALVTAYMEGAVSNARMQTITSEHAADLTKTLRKLVDDGFLTQTGKKRGTLYTLSRKGDSLPLFSSSPDTESTHVGADSAHNAQDSVHDAGDSTHVAGDSTHTRRLPVLEALPDAMLERLDGISQPSFLKSQLPNAETRRIILALCSEYSLTSQQLGALMNRSPSGLRERFLKPMVDDGLLVREFPDEPNRPDQAYRARDTTEPQGENNS